MWIWLALLVKRPDSRPVLIPKGDLQKETGQSFVWMRLVRACIIKLFFFCHRIDRHKICLNELECNELECYICLTRRIVRANARLVLKIQKFAFGCILTWKLYYFFTIHHPIILFIIVNYVLLLVKIIQIWSTYNNNLMCWALIILCI